MPKLIDQTRIQLDVARVVAREPFAVRLVELWRALWLWYLCHFQRWVRLGFTMQSQLQTQWCWAAVSTSVSRFFDSGSPWVQCTVVNAELGQTTCCSNGSTSQCNQPWYLNAALTRTGNLASWAGGTATMAQIRSEINAGRPLGVRIGWSGGGGHFVAIAGYRCYSPDYIDVRDPIYGSTDIALTTFTTSYQGTGSWTHTYYTEA